MVIAESMSERIEVGVAQRVWDARKPAPADVPPPPVGVRSKPAPDTLPPPPGVMATTLVIVPPAPRVVRAPEPELVIPATLVVAAESEPSIEPAAVSEIICDPSSVPMLAALIEARASSMPRSAVLAFPAREPTRAWRRPLAIALGAAASLLLTVGLSTSPDASPTIEPAPASDTGFEASASALISAWTTSRRPTDATTPEPAPAPAASPEPLHDDLLAVALPTDEVTPTLEPTTPPRRSRRARHRGHAPTITTVDTTPEPTPAPRRSSSSRRPRPVSAEELLFDGEVALRLGDAKQAYRLAKRSRDSGAHPDAASLVARSACRIGERNEAKQALRELPLLERGAVRRDCRRSGSRIGM